MADRPSRFPPLADEAMTPDQRTVANAIRTGPRGGLRGPFQAWLRSPELAQRLQAVGEYVRFSSSIPARLNELAILITARAWDSSAATQPEDVAALWNPKGYVNTARPRIHVRVV